MADAPELTSMAGKVCLVTGATSGIGEAAALGLARLGARVIVVGRNAERCRDTLDRIQRESGNTLAEALLADLSDQEQVRRLAAAVRNRTDRLDVLVNNAGAFFFWRKVSADGIEKTFALNHLSCFLLTNLLLDIIRATDGSRIVNVSSATHREGTLDFDDLQFTRRYRGWAAYARSKLCNILFTRELARRLEGSGVAANALHPGFVRTRIGRNNGLPGRLIAPLIFGMGRSPADGADTILYLATAPEMSGPGGRYYVNRREVRSSELSYDTALARRLWEVSRQMTGLSVRT